VTVVTSRDALAGLVAADGALRLEVDLLPLAEAAGLLRGLIGTRADDDPDAAMTLATQCCRLPLALRVAAELAAASPDVPLAVLAGELADLQHRLDVLETGGDERTAVRSVFTWSYRHLDPDAARLFRLLGLHPGLDLDVHAAAALAAATVAAARRMLDALARAHLTQPAGPGRHAMHDLLRAYARELARAEGSEDEKQAALTRLFDFYLHAAATAMDTLFPAERHRRPRIPAPPAEVPRFAGAAGALVWLDAERSSLTAVTAHAATQGWPTHATRLSATLFRYLDTQGHHPEATAIHTHACQAARQAGDAAGEADACNSLGVMSMRQGRLEQAAERFENALTLYRQTASQVGQARALSNLGFIEYILGRSGQAPVHLRGAVELFREVGDQVGEARTLASLGYVGLRQGSYQQAAGHLRRSLALCKRVADRGGQARALGYLGEIESRLGRFPQATAKVQQALALFQELGDRISEADTLASLGLIDLRQGHYDQALAHLKHALAVSKQTGDLSSLAAALNGLGEVLLATGRPAQARTHLATALDTAIQASEKYEQARAHHGLSRACQASGHPVQAGHHRTQALTLYTDLGTPEAGQIRTQLADCRHEPSAFPAPPQAGRRRRSAAAGGLQP
jgi:tetratricopeptide (TPR) repeat protein